MPPDPPREQGPPGLATPTQINATPTSKTVENPDSTPFSMLGFVFHALLVAKTNQRCWYVEEDEK